MATTHLPYEVCTSPLPCSNDGRVRVDPVRETTPNGFIVVDSHDNHVELFTIQRAIADAFVAGYDYRDRLNNEDGIALATRLLSAAIDAGELKGWNITLID